MRCWKGRTHILRKYAVSYVISLGKTQSTGHRQTDRQTGEKKQEKIFFLIIKMRRLCRHKIVNKNPFQYGFCVEINWKQIQENTIQFL